MQVVTIFDGHPPRPLLSAIYDGHAVDVIPLYLRGTKRSLFDVQHDIESVSNRINASDFIILNDAKSHISTFKLKTDELYQVVNLNLPNSLSLDQYKKLFKSILPLKIEKEHWRKLLALASKTYLEMESRYVYLDEQRVFPQYSLDTFSGRSRCTNFNLQGAPEGTPVKVKDCDLFLCLDWVSADLRVATYLSKDEELEELFKESDPYSGMAEMLQIPRKECKTMMLRTLYALDLTSPILDLFPTLKTWITSQLELLSQQGYLSSSLGRKFLLKTRDERSVFNATLQGTVAHAMQNTLIKMREVLGRFLLTETHDSIIFACNKGILTKVLREATSIMGSPLDGLPKMPFKAYIGKEWKRWKLYKVYR
jgi:hypothetical protein